MNTVVDRGIVIRRTNYGEADRIVTFLTAQNGKITCLAKGVRKQKSKLAGGIEPFCINEICFASGRGELKTLTSAKIISQHTSLISNLNRLDLAQQIIKLIDRKTEENSAGEYFDLLSITIKQANTNTPVPVVEMWWLVNLASILGNNPNTAHQTNGQPFSENSLYLFDLDSGGFFSHSDGVYTPSHVKILKLAMNNLPEKLIKIAGAESLASDILPSLRSFTKLHFS